MCSSLKDSPAFRRGSRQTLSKGIDQGIGYLNQFDQTSERGPSQLDQTHRLVLSGSWSPVTRGLTGFTFSSVATIGSGRPYTAVFDTPNVNVSSVPEETFNSFRGPGVRGVHVSVARAFKLSERFGLKLRAEAFDVLNHANFQQNAVDNV
jgi:hypothetical protein